MSDLPAQIIIVHPNGERQTFTHDTADPLWWRDDRDLFNGWRRLAGRINLFMEAQSHMTLEEPASLPEVAQGEGVTSEEMEQQAEHQRWWTRYASGDW